MFVLFFDNISTFIDLDFLSPAIKTTDHFISPAACFASTRLPFYFAENAWFYILQSVNLNCTNEHKLLTHQIAHFDVHIDGFLMLHFLPFLVWNGYLKECPRHTYTIFRKWL